MTPRVAINAVPAKMGRPLTLTWQMPPFWPTELASGLITAIHEMNMNIDDRLECQ
jgi:hypothetical protein